MRLSGTRTALPFLAAGLILPGLLVAAWAILVFGGPVTDLAEEELRGAGTALTTLEDEVRVTLLTAANSEGFAIRVTADGRPSGPFLRPRETSPPAPSVGESPPALQAARDLESRGRFGEALEFLRFLEAQQSQALDPEVVLALARCLHAQGETTTAIEKLRHLKERQPRDLGEGLLPLGLTIDLLIARIAAESGDQQPARDLRLRILAAKAYIPAGSAASILDRLNVLAGTEADADEERLRRAARVVMALEHGYLTLPEEYSRLDGGALLVRVGSQELRLLTGTQTADLVTTAVALQELRHPELELIAGPDTPRSLASLDLAPLGGQIHVAWRGTRPSRRLEQLAWGLLILAGGVFLGGNLWLLRLARREVAVSRLKSSFIDVVSHELRTPLTALSLKAEMLAGGHVPQDRHDAYHASLHAEMRKLTELVNRILDFARLEKGASTLDRKPIDSRQVIAQGVRAGRSALRLAGQKLSVQVPRELPPLEGDSEVIVRALRNLLENAARYAPRSSEVDLTAEVGDGNRLVISVADRGPGIPPGERSGIFEPFRRVATNGEGRVNGSGLGLALVAQAAIAHQGSVEVRDRAGGGSIFVLSLPALKTST